MDLLVLYKAFSANMLDYIPRHNTNYAAIETAINEVRDWLNVQLGGSSSMPAALKKIFDRTGVVGKDSYVFTAGVKTAPDYNIVVAPGAFWNGASFFSILTSTTLSMLGKLTDTYYINLDATGTPGVDDVPSASTVYQFEWDAATHTVSAIAMYAGVSILFSGEDYADMLVSTARSKTFTDVATRLEELELAMAEMGMYYSFDHLSGLNFYYNEGRCRSAESQMYLTEAGHVLCTDDAVNYIEVLPSDGTVSVNQIGFTSGSIPLFKDSIESGVHTVTDMRTWACVGGGGGGGGGHAQNTDTGTSSDHWKMDLDATGHPTGRVYIEVENGDDPNSFLAWNRTTSKWEYSVDGVVWVQFGVSENLGAQEITKYVGVETVDLVLEALGISTSADWEDLDLSAYVAAPDGMQAVDIRVQFWDAEPSSSVFVMFRKKGSGAMPVVGAAVWSNQFDLASLTVPSDADNIIQYMVMASGPLQANLRVYILGYQKVVTGVGTEDKSFLVEGIEVAAASTVDTNATGFIIRGLAHRLQMEETGGMTDGFFGVELYARDTFLEADLLYRATNIVPGAAFVDLLPFWVQDKDASEELHLRIINSNATVVGTFTVTIDVERFA